MSNTYTVTMTEGYMGSTGYMGNHSGLFGADLSAGIRAAFKECGIKGATVKVSTYSGGQSITVTVKAKPAEFLTVDEMTQKLSVLDTESFGWVYDPDARQSVDMWEAAEWDNDKKQRCIRTYAENLRTRYSGKYGNNINQYHIDEIKEMRPELRRKLAKIKSICDSFNYSRTNIMVDYFDCGFYLEIRVKEVE